MTDTEQKALALVNAAKQDSERTIPPFACGLPTMYKALLAAIEAHEADKKAFSDAAARADKLLHRMAECVNLWSDVRDEIDAARSSLSPFILPEPEPDPLVEAMNEALGSEYEEYFPSQAEMLRDALAARGYKIERIEQ